MCAATAAHASQTPRATALTRVPEMQASVASATVMHLQGKDSFQAQLESTLHQQQVSLSQSYLSHAHVYHQQLAPVRIFVPPLADNDARTHARALSYTIMTGLSCVLPPCVLERCERATQTTHTHTNTRTHTNSQARTHTHTRTHDAGGSWQDATAISIHVRHASPNGRDRHTLHIRRRHHRCPSVCFYTHTHTHTLPVVDVLELERWS